MMLLREAIGDRLRRTRTSQRRTLREVSRVARVSLGYLSEVERGRKEPSSELLPSICDALDLPLDELLRRVANDLGPVYLPEVPDTLAAELVAA
jgi:transcriptional regulator with XRE-family HTH domain